ncbi:MAG: hypothetical protein ACKKL6_02310 [Candidatus Komeilibacteria bacterium]
MQFYLDLSYFEYLGSLSVPQVMWELFISGGWIFFVIVFLQFLWTEWLNARQTRWMSDKKFVLLAIDVPKDNEQSPMAVEQMMTNLAGAHAPYSKWELWWEGAVQLAFSLEIVSIDGYIQFLIRTPDFLRDMIEAAVYAQYPEAEITEVEDYVDTIPDVYPNDTHKFWGSELEEVRHWAYPIRTYKEFEHGLTQELKDPMAALLEMFSRLGKGEQAWFQIIVKPGDYAWQGKGKAIVDKITGKAPKVDTGALGKFGGAIATEAATWGAEAANSLFGTSLEVSAAQSPKDDSMAMFNMTPLTRHSLESVERKLAKEGFECKIRLVYTATKEAWKKGQRVGTFFSVVKQFGSGASNSFKPSKAATTKANYLFAERRIIAKTNKLVKAYKTRSTWMGMPAFILNVEELATLYHFPAFTIKAPLLKRTEAKKGEPPSSLPMEEDIPTPVTEEPVEQKVEEAQYLPDSLKDYDFSNQEFEKKFAKKDTSEDEVVEDTNIPPGNLPFVE